MSITIRKLRDDDKGYAISSWRESYKQAPGVDRVPWPYFKATVGADIANIVNNPNTVLLGAYDHADRLLGWIAMTPSKRMQTVHWIYVKHKVDNQGMRRRGIASALLEAANVGRTFLYTLHARRHRARLPDGSTSKSFDETLVAALRAKGIIASYLALKEWLKP